MIIIFGNFIAISAQNNSLKVLDLQWNHIRRQSAVQLCKALAVRITLDVICDLEKNIFLRSCGFVYRN